MSKNLGPSYVMRAILIVSERNVERGNVTFKDSEKHQPTNHQKFGQISSPIRLVK